MYISFPRKIRGRANRLSISIPKSICEDYDIQPDDFLSVTIEDKPKNPELRIRFPKKVARAGTEGRLIYLRKKDVEKYGLKRNTVVLVTLEEA